MTLFDDDSGPSATGRSSVIADGSLSGAVIRTVAAYSNTEPTKLPPLHETVDPDALELIFASQLDGTPRLEGNVTFPYAGYHVTVTADREVTVERLEDEER